MAAPKKRPKIQASDIEVNNRTLEAVLADLAERSVRAEERSARAEEKATIALQQSAIALKSIESMLQDLRALTQEFREANQRAERRLNAIEQAAE